MPRGTVDRKASARELLEHCKGRLTEVTDPTRLGRLHYECARLLEYPLLEADEAIKHYREALNRLPSHEPTVAGLRRVLLATKKWDAALPLYDAQVRLTGPANDKAALLYEKGRLLEDRLSKKAEARAAYEAALELDPSDASILRAVACSQRRAAAWNELDQTLDRLTRLSTGDERVRAAQIAARARLTEVKKRDVGLATELLQRAFDTHAHASGALGDLLRLHGSQRRFKDLIAALERQVEQARDPKLRAAALYRIGRLLADRLGNIDGAIQALERAYQQAPDDTLVLDELVRMYEAAGHSAGLVNVLERLVARTEDLSKRVELMQRLGHLNATEVGNEEAAITWYERALADEPTHAPVLQALAKIYTRRGAWEPLVALHLREAENSHHNLRRAAARFRIAEIHERHLGSRERAMAEHARALGLVPGYDPSFRALARLYTETRKYAELVELFERAVELAADEETQFTYLFKIGRIHEDALDDAGTALDTYKRILDLDDGHLGAVHAMQRAAERSAHYDVLVFALEHEAKLLDDPRRKVALLHRAGEVSEELLRDDDAALAFYDAVLHLDPRYAPALSSLGRIHFRAGRWEDLLKVYRSELPLAAGPRAKADIYYRMGVLCEERMGRDDDAIANYRKAIDALPVHTAALEALQRKLAENGREKELAKLLEGELATIDDERKRAVVALRLGEVQENLLDQPDRALASYELALRGDPELRAALDGRSRLLSEKGAHAELVRALEDEASHASDPLIRVGARLRAGEVLRDDLGDASGAAQAYEAVLSEEPQHPAALLALEVLYADSGDVENLRRILNLQANTFADAGEKVAALRELVRLGDGAEVSEELGRILQLAPKDRRALELVEQRAISSESDETLAQVDAKLHTLAEQTALAAAHATRLGEYFEPSNPVRALEQYRYALEKEGENVAAARGVSRVAEAVGDPELMAEAAEGEAQVTKDFERAAALLVQAAEARKQSGAVDRAVAALERALQVNPDHLPAASRLVDLLASMGDIDRLITVLSRAAQNASTKERGARHWIAVAGLYADKKSDVPAALAALGRVEKELPRNVPTLLELAELYGRDKQWREAVIRLQRVLSAKPEPKVATAVNLRLAELLHERLDEPKLARAALDSVLEQSPDHREALQRLLALQMSAGEADAVATTERLAELSTDPKAKAKAYTMLGRLNHERRDVEAAASAYESAVRLCGPAGEAGKGLRELLSGGKLEASEKRWAGYASALNEFCGIGGTPGGELAEAHLELGRVLADRLRDPAKSIQALERGLSHQPRDMALRVELATRLKRAGGGERALEELRRVLDMDPMRIETWRDLAEVFEALGRNVEAHLALGSLVLLGGANELQKSTWAARVPRTGQVADGGFDSDAFATIDALGGEAEAVALLGQLADGLGKVFPQDVEQYGVTARDRVTSRMQHPLRPVADRVARIFGAPDFDLYPAMNYHGPVMAVLTDPVGIILPGWYTDLSEVDQVFTIGRPLANLARRLHVVDAVSAEEVGLLLRAAGRTVDPSFGGSSADEDAVMALSKRVPKAISWLGRGRFEDAARAFVHGPYVDSGKFVRRARVTAARAALVVADDVRSSVALVRRLEGDGASLDSEAQARGMHVVRDLLRFWTSDPAMAVRRRLGIV